MSYYGTAHFEQPIYIIKVTLKLSLLATLSFCKVPVVKTVVLIYRGPSQFIVSLQNCLLIERRLDDFTFYL